MDARSFLKVIVLGCAVVLFTTGCPSVTPPENAVTWGIKAATGRLTEATPTEWQALTEQIDARTPNTDVSLTDDQAQAIVDFLVANDLNSVQDITELVAQATSDPNSVSDIEIPDSLTSLFGDIDFESVSNDILSGV